MQNFNLAANANQTFVLTLDFSGWAALFNLAASKIRMQMRQGPFLPVIFEWSTDNGLAVLDGTNVRFLAAIMDVLNFGGNYDFDIRIENSVGAPIVVSSGKIFWTKGITRTSGDETEADTFSGPDTVSVNGVISQPSIVSVPFIEVYDGVWNAATNTPTLVSGAGVKGHYRIVSVDGSTNIDGNASWATSDKIIFNGTVWEKISRPPSTSVDGYYNASLHGISPAQAAAVNAPAMQTLIATALSVGITTIYMPEGEYDLTGVGPSIHKVRLIGPGTITGVYRKTVEPYRSTNTFLSDATLVPSKHMKRFLAADSPVVVIAGDSLTFPPVFDANSQRNGLFDKISNYLSAKFPEKNITIIHRGIGGARFFDFDTVATSMPEAWLPDWYIDHDAPWLDYVKDVFPDLVIVSYGMNDGALFNITFNERYLYESINKMRAWDKDPDIVLCTNYLPSLSTTTPGWGGEGDQDGRDAVAGYVRSFAEFGGYGLLDFNRWFDVMRDGFDPVGFNMFDQNSSFTQTIPFVGPKKTRDFMLEASFTSIPADFWDPEGDGSSPLIIPLSYSVKVEDPPPYIDANYVKIFDDDGKLRVVATAGWWGFSSVDERTNVTTPSAGSNVVFFIKVHANRLHIAVNGSVLYEGPVVRYGSWFYPTMKYLLNNTGATGTFKLVAGDPARYSPVLLDSEIFNAGKEESNGLNHATATGHQYTYAEPLSRQSWADRRAVSPLEKLRDLIGSASGIAIDFTNDLYLKRIVGIEISGSAESIVANAISYATDTDGNRIGLLAEGSEQNSIAVAHLPLFASAYGTLIVEAKSVDPGGGQAYALSLSKAAVGVTAGRIDIYGQGTAINGLLVNNSDTITGVTQTAPDPHEWGFYRVALAWDANMFTQCGNGLGVNRALLAAGALPTGLTHLKLGFADTAAPNPVVIKRLVFLPKTLSARHLLARTF